MVCYELRTFSYDDKRLIINKGFQEKIKAPIAIASCCQEYRDQGLNTNGTYFIQPDRDLDPFEVICIFYGAVGTTVINHVMRNDNQVTAQPGTLTGCHDPGCFNVREIPYHNFILSLGHGNVYC